MSNQDVHITLHFAGGQVKELFQIFLLYGGGMNARWIGTGKHEPVISVTRPETTDAYVRG